MADARWRMTQRLVSRLVPRRWRETVDARVRLRQVPSRPQARPRFSGLGSDVRLAWRSLRREPGSSVTIVMTLALGIAATTATYGVFNLVIFRPVPGVANPDRLVSIYVQVDRGTPSRTSASGDQFRAMKTAVPALAAVAAWSFGSAPFAATPTDPPAMQTLMHVTSGFFDVLGVRPLAGRLFSSQQPDNFAEATVVVSEYFWRTRLAADPAAVGRPVFLNGRPFVVIGIAGGFRGIDPVRAYDVWIPNGATWTADPPDLSLEWATMVGRLRPGVSADVAQAEALAASRAVGPIIVDSKTYIPAVFAGLTDGVGLTRQRLLNIFWILQAGMLTLLLLACANAANLLLARNARRTRELAVRAAIGASRRRLLRLLLLEGATQAVLAAAIGLALARLAMELFRGAHLLTYLPALDDLSIDWRVAGFACGAATVTVLAFALTPALLASQVNPQPALQSAGRATPRTARLRSALIATQLALSLTLLFSAGLMVQTVAHLTSVDLGFTARNLVSFYLEPYRAGYDDDRGNAVFRLVRDRLRELPGTEASVSWSGLLANSVGMRLSSAGPGTSTPLHTSGDYVSADFFETLGISLHAGRTFTAAEERQAKPPVLPLVVNETAARQLFGSLDVVGRQLVSSERSPRLAEIIGLVGTVRDGNLRAEVGPVVYQPLGHSLRVGHVLMRSTASVSEMVSTIRRVVRDIDPALPVGRFETVESRLDDITTEERLLARVSAIAAVIASLLATGGLYAFLAFAVAERTREWGIRLALGASGRQIAASLTRALLPAILGGLVVGGGLIVLAGRWLSSRLFEVGALDWRVLLASLSFLGAGALAAAYLPARRASRVDPTIALRAE